jgi:heat-inducible transcriptional repressor
LKTLIETYLTEGGPVGSRLLSKRFGEPVSPATIRNVLADLEEAEMVSQPHSSAGRLPTERAYRYYVDHWIRPIGPNAFFGDQLAPALEGLDQDPDLWLRHASRVLSEVMQGICVALPLNLSTSRLLRLEFVPLGEDRIVAVWVGTAGDVEHQVMDNPWGFPAETLRELGNYATYHFAGSSLAEMRARLLDALKNGADEAIQLRQRLSELASRLSDSSDLAEPPVVVSGLREMGKLPEFEDFGRFRALVAAFEEHERLARLLIAFAESASREVTLLLGSENPYLPPMPLATAMRTVLLGKDERVTFALVSPMRMDYMRVLGGLAWWSAEVARRQAL